MLNRKIKKFALGASAIVLSLSAAPLWAQTINIGVAANFFAPVGVIASQFQAANPGTTYTFNVTSGATGNLEATIIAGGATGPYDLFLAANEAAPADLKTNHSSLVIGNPFTYAQGSLLLWSNGIINVSGGLPVPLTQDVVIADVVNAPYGTAAQQVLHNVYSINLPATHVVVDGDIGTTFASVDDTTYPMGFVAKSQLCVNGVVQPRDGTYHEYTSGYTPIIQDGIEINRTRSAADTTAVEAFISFLRTSMAAKDTILNFCYVYPSTSKTPVKAVKPTPKKKM